MQIQYELLTDPQWEVIKEKLPIQRKRKYDLRDIVNAIFWILRTGSQWRNLPKEFPKWQLVYRAAAAIISASGREMVH